MADVTGRCCRIFLFLIGYCILHTKGACEFPKAWAGHWFQSGIPHTLLINATFIQTKGDCYEEQGDKYLVYDRSDNCYRCMAIHVKHASVLQYKETYCETKSTFQDICNGITGDAPLYSMFRKHPEARPVACPFKGAPFTFSYSRGSGDCMYPPSQAESCTDDSRLVLRYQACPDIASTESNVEELVCLATWKEGSTRYLIGRLRQGGRRAASDEDQFRCFVYQKGLEGGRGVYNIAQSGDATCSGLQNAFEGSRTMKLTSVDLHHTRCKFPSWVTDHHTWLGLDHRRTYRFSQRNATLKILDEDTTHHHLGLEQTSAAPVQQQQQQQFGFQDVGLQSEGLRKGGGGEARVVCHAILQAVEGRRLQIVAHITAGCDSGYVCMVFYKRDNNVIEIQQSDIYQENPNDACRLFDTTAAPYTTLITPILHPKKCPHPGRFSTITPPLTPLQAVTVGTNGRRKRQGLGASSIPTGGGDFPGSGVVGVGGSSGGPIPDPVPAACLRPHGYEALATGCTSAELMEFRTGCPHQPTQGYTCHGSWQDNRTYYVIASPIARRSSDPLRICIAYTLDSPAAGSYGNTADDLSLQHLHLQQQQRLGNAGTAAGTAAAGFNRSVAASTPTTLRLSGLAASCHRDATPGTEGVFAFNFTINGTCAQTESGARSGNKAANFLLSIGLPILSAIFVSMTTKSR